MTKLDQTFIRRRRSAQNRAVLTQQPHALVLPFFNLPLKILDPRCQVSAVGRSLAGNDL